MKDFYVSLTRDLIGVYLHFQAESDKAVRQYLQAEYQDAQGNWKLPWCAVYDNLEEISRYGEPILIKAKCGELSEDESEVTCW